MKHASCLALSLTLVLLHTPGLAQADACFPAAGKVSLDAENIRHTALELGWEVGNAASYAAALFAEAKGKLKPADYVEICLRVEPDKPKDTARLMARAQSKAPGAGAAKWHNLHAKRTTP
jgi:hypothetical protein